MQALGGGMMTYLSLVFKWFRKLCVWVKTEERDRKNLQHTQK